MIPPPTLETARENLKYIRRTLEAAGQFTAVPGRCLMAAGLIALAGVAVNLVWTGAPWAPAPRNAAALETWGVVLGLSVAVVGWGIYRKAQTTGVRLPAPLLRKMLWSLCPALFVGAILTHVAVRGQQLDWLPAIWLGCYGVAVTSGGQVSVAPVRYMGLSLLTVAGAAAVSPAGYGLAWLAIGFGWIHLVGGAYIAWRHNG